MSDIPPPNELRPNIEPQKPLPKTPRPVDMEPKLDIPEHVISPELIGIEPEITTPLADPQVDKYSEQRNRLKVHLQEKGEILPEDHEYTKLIRKVTEKLGLPEDTELMVVDTEEMDAFFDPQSRTVAFTRGMSRYLLGQGLELTEDHVAAILSHELEHARVIGDDYVNRLKTNYLERLKSSQNHAEEYRADADAMRRLSRSGYNPRAVVDVLRAFPLTSGRGDMGHPEQIERVRKLEDLLADDEHPLSHTAQKHIALEQNILTWVTQDSGVYSKTEQLLHSSTNELDGQLTTAKTQQEFWNTYNHKKIIDRVAATNVLVEREDEKLGNLSLKLMIYDAFCGKEAFVGRQPARIDPAINNNLIDEKGGISDEGSSKIFSAGNTFSEEYKVTELLKSQEFRKIVKSELPEGISLDKAVTDITTLEGLIDRAIQGRLDLVFSMPLGQHEQEYYGMLKHCFESGQVDENLLLTLFPHLDTQYQLELQQETTGRNRDSGLRDSEQSPGVFDFSTEKDRAKLMSEAKFALASSLIDIPQPSDNTINILAKTIGNDSGLNEQEARILSETILMGEDAGSWVGYLQGQDKDSLRRIIRSVNNFSDSNDKLRFSPFRSLHQSYLASSNQAQSSEGYKSFASGSEYGIDTSGLEAIKMLAAREFYLRGCPPGFKLDYNNSISPSQVNLSMDEWDLVVEGKANYGIQDERNEWALIKYLDQVKSGGEIDPKMTEYAREHAGVSNSTTLTTEQIQMMLDNSLWEPGRLQRMTYQAVQNWIDVRRYPDGKPLFTLKNVEFPTLSENDRKDLIELLRKTHRSFVDNPIVEKVDGKQRYDNQPKPEQVGSLLLDVLIQDIQTTGISEKDATVHALTTLANDNILINYGAITEKTIGYIGNFTQADIESLLTLLKSGSSFTENRVDLIENFQLLSFVPDSDRPEVAKNPICETSIRAVLESKGEDSITWVLDNFHQSDSRDILLIGLYEFVGGEQKSRFEIQIINNLTENPDKYHAKNSPSFPYDLYYRDVKVDEEPADKFKGEGRIAASFDDLLRRRHPFSTLSFRPNNAAFIIYDPMGNVGERYGSVYQSFIADRLIKNEGTIFNKDLKLDQRTEALIEAAPYRSVVRDVYIEMLLQDELTNATSDLEKVQQGRALLPLFTDQSELKGPPSTQVLRAELAVNPNLTSNYDAYIALVTHYLPEPSLARNYFLNQFENNTPLTVEQLKQVVSMRMSPEGKKKEDDNAPMTFVVNRLGELNRDERVKATFWLLGLSAEKPKAINQLEKRFDGQLDNFPRVIAATTDDEKEIIFKRLFLGAEGIVDLEAVPEAGIETATSQRKEFLRTLSIQLLPDIMPNADLFRNIFTTVLESSDAPHASRILTKIIGKIYDAKMTGQQLPPEEVIALGLNELGVVGKKVSQSIAELDWVPDSYKKTLRKSQSEGEVVPKRALLTLAEDAGLLDENSPIRVVSFDKLIGAASNKQAAILTVEVSDEKVGLSVGIHQVVGKFKRPSAQKTENIDHDLRVLKGILGILGQEGYADTLPRDFSAQINNAVKRELDFQQERQFNEDIRPDLNERNTKRKHKVSIPTIYVATDDVMVESIAQGISLRQYQNLREAGARQILESGYATLSEKEVNQTVLTEALSQLITTGNIHTDLHPGNIFVDQHSDVTLIDLGMNERISSQQRLNTISLIAGLATGNESFVKKSLIELGWNLGDVSMNLSQFNFADNTTQLLKASQKASSPPSEIVSSIILATSKLSTYTKGFTNAELARMLIGTIDKKEVPKILAHLVKSGLGN